MGDMILYRSTNGFGADLTNYKVMTVVINEADSNPATCCSYADDAVNMQSGASANAQWQEFFGYKPCLFKNGQVVGYLNPNDYSKFENGGAADITSGDAGDVMIEFPRRGIRCVKDGDTIRISMTDAPNDPDFKYYAHQRGTVSKDAFYIGAYVGTYANDSSETSSNKSIKIRSLSGQKLVRASNQSGTKAINKQYDLKRTQCQNNGAGYECFPYVLMIFIQVMYVLQFKNLNSVDMLGVRFIHGSSFSVGGDGVFYGYDDYRSGSTNSKGLFLKNSYKTETSAKTESTKTFGIEDLLAFGYINDGIVSSPMTVDGDSSNDLFVVTMVALGVETYEDTFDNYTVVFDERDYDGNHPNSWRVSKVIGTTNCPFYPCAGNGSTTTYYCAYAHDNIYVDAYVRLHTCRTIYVDGWTDYDYTSIFTIDSLWSTDALLTTRLCYI